MSNNYPRDLSFTAVNSFVDRTWRRNTTGGGYRPISATGMAHYIYMGEGGESFIRISYDGQDIVDMTAEWVEIDLSAGVRSVPLIKLLNRVLEDNQVPYFVPTYKGTNMLCYADGEGVAFDRIITARYYHENGRFTVVNGRIIADYRTKENNS